MKWSYFFGLLTLINLISAFMPGSFGEQAFSCFLTTLCLKWTVDARKEEQRA